MTLLFLCDQACIYPVAAWTCSSLKAVCCFYLLDLAFLRFTKQTQVQGLVPAQDRGIYRIGAYIGYIYTYAFIWFIFIKGTENLTFIFFRIPSSLSFIATNRGHSKRFILIVLREQNFLGSAELCLMLDRTRVEMAHVMWEVSQTTQEKQQQYYVSAPFHFPTGWGQWWHDGVVHKSPVQSHVCARKRERRHRSVDLPFYFVLV